MHLNLKDFPWMCQSWNPCDIVLGDVSRVVTRVAIREARLSEIKRELLNSEKHFQSNDAAVSAISKRNHLTMLHVLHDTGRRASSSQSNQTTNGFLA